MSSLRFYLFFLISMVAAFGLAQELPLQNSSIVKPLSVQEKHLIPNAVGIQITPHGLLLFKNKLKEVLGTLGADIESANFDGFTQESQTTYSLNHLELPPDAQELLNSFRSMVSKWFVGFALDDIRPGFQMGNSNYVARFKKLSIEPDQKIFMNLAKSNGAVLDVDVEIQEMDINTDKVLVYDVNRKEYLQGGLENAGLKIAGGQQPLTIRMPIYVKIDPSSGRLEFTAVDVQTNFNQVDLDLKYKKLAIPQIAVVIGKKTFPIDQVQIQKQLDQNMKQILTKVRGYLDTFASQQLPKILNKKAEEYLAGTLEETNSQSAPASNCTSTMRQFIKDFNEHNLPVPQNQDAQEAQRVKLLDARNNCTPLLWGLQLMSINQGVSSDQQSFLKMDLQAYVEDNLNIASPLMPDSVARGTVDFNDLSMDQYDIGMSLNRGLINRFLSLSFDRKLFKYISSPDDGKKSSNGPAYIMLAKAPVVDYVMPPAGVIPNPKESYIKVHAKIQMPPDYPGFWQQIAVDRGFQVDVDIIYKLHYGTFLVEVQDPKFPNDLSKKKLKKVTGIGMFPWSFDKESVQVDPKYTHLGFGKTVNNRIANALAESSVRWQQADLAKPQEILPLPPQSLGNMLDVKKIVMDSTGNLVMYLNYSKNSWKLLNAKTIDAIQISGLSRYQGQYLTVYYASAHGAAIATSNNQVVANKMLLTKNFQITGDSVSLPKVPFPKDGLFAANYIIMVVHPTKNFSWSNDPAINSTYATAIDSESVSDLMGTEQSGQNEINYSFGSGI